MSNVSIDVQIILIFTGAELVTDTFLPFCSTLITMVTDPAIILTSVVFNVEVLKSDTGLHDDWKLLQLKWEHSMENSKALLEFSKPPFHSDPELG